MLQNAVIRFPPHRKEECDDKKSGFEFLISSFCPLRLFRFLCRVSLSGNGGRSEREEAAGGECWVRNVEITDVD